MDLVIRHAMLADGAGPLDVGIKAGRIAAIAAGLPVEAAAIDAAGCLLTPGLVETHFIWIRPASWTAARRSRGRCKRRCG